MTVIPHQLTDEESRLKLSVWLDAMYEQGVLQ